MPENSYLRLLDASPASQLSTVSRTLRQSDAYFTKQAFRRPVVFTLKVCLLSHCRLNQSATPTTVSAEKLYEYEAR